MAVFKNAKQYPEVPILDNGYMQLVETWGCDERVVEAARMSNRKGFGAWEPYEGHPKGDAGLLSYMASHKHGTPFEMAGMTIVVQAPIMVFREWHRHRTQSYNEMSARYTPLPDVNYLPTIDRCMMAAGKNKQAAAVDGAKELTEVNADLWTMDLDDHYRHCEQLYQDALKVGIPKELARLCLPVGRYSRMMASANLRNWLAFLTLRSAPDAQWEIRQYADHLGTLVAEHFPQVWKTFIDRRP